MTDIDITLRVLQQRPEHWMATHCNIRTKRGEIIPFRLNEAQIRIMQVIEDLQAAGRPVRIIVLKARQMGVSTFTEALMYYFSNNRPNITGLVSAHDDESSTSIFQMIQLMQEDNTEPRPTDYTNRKEIIYSAPHRSKMAVQTAGKTKLGRSSTLHFFHGSEVAFWPYAKESLNAVHAAISKDPGTFSLLESTANGMGGEFYERWCQAVKGESEYVPVFLAWHEFDEYRLPPGRHPSLDPNQDGEPWSQEENRRRREYNLDDDQMIWYRYILRNDCGNDEELMKQEYPSNWQEAFIVGGRPFFQPFRLMRMDAEVKVAPFRGRFEAGQFVMDETGPVRIWYQPRYGEPYAMGCDTAEGIQDDDHRDPDASVAYVMSRERTVVAECHSRHNVDLFSEQADALGRHFNDALLGFEINNTSGGEMRQCLKRLNYPNLYTRERYDQHGDVTTEKIGWRTDTATRMMMLGDLQKAIRENLVRVPSDRLMIEMRAFHYDKTGKPQAMTGEHDDCVMAFAIAYQMLITVLEQFGTFTLSDTAGKSVIELEARPVFQPDYVMGGCEEEDYTQYMELDS